MTTRSLIVAAVAAAITLTTVPANATPDSDPVVIGHRGASGYRPEHTLASYQLAIEQGADFIEPDVVSTKDGVLVTRHENEISGTTDVATHPEFADRRTTKVIDGTSVTGWFTEDFTYAELRPCGPRSGCPPSARTTRPTTASSRSPPSTRCSTGIAAQAGVGVYPETKHPSYFDSIGLSLEEPLVAALAAHDLDDKTDDVIVQSFEVGNLQELNRMTKVDLAQLVDATKGPADRPGVTYASMVTPAGLQAISKYADGLGAHKDWCCPARVARPRCRPTWSATRTRLRLIVHVWTLRRENQFMATNFRRRHRPERAGRPVRGDAGVPRRRRRRSLLRQPRHRGGGRWPTGSAASPGASPALPAAFAAASMSASSRASRSAAPGSAAPRGVRRRPALRRTPPSTSGFERRPVRATARRPARPAATQGSGRNQRRSSVSTCLVSKSSQIVARPTKATPITRWPTLTGWRPEWSLFGLVVGVGCSCSWLTSLLANGDLANAEVDGDTHVGDFGAAVEEAAPG